MNVGFGGVLLPLPLDAVPLLPLPLLLLLLLLPLPLDPVPLPPLPVAIDGYTEGTVDGIDEVN